MEQNTLFSFIAQLERKSNEIIENVCVGCNFGSRLHDCRVLRHARRNLTFEEAWTPVPDDYKLALLKDLVKDHYLTTTSKFIFLHLNRIVLK